MSKSKKRIDNHGHLYSPSRAWVAQHGQSFKAAIFSLSLKKLAALFTIIVISIALALPTIFLSLADQMSSLTKIFNATPKINLYLNPEIEGDALQTLSGRLMAISNVKTANIISPESALEELQETLNLGGAEAFFDTNPLPTTIVVTPMDDVAINTIADLEQNFQNYSEVESVQVDTDWVRRWKALVTMSEQLSHFITVSLFIAVLFIIGNTIRLEARQQEEHIRISKLMGATHAFIRRPFVYTGFLYGLTGGILALILVLFFYRFLRDSLIEFLSTFSPTFTDAFTATGSGLHYYLPLAGSFIGVFGAWIAVQYYIKHLSIENKL